MAKHRNHSADFKRQVAQEFLSSETLHGPAKRHDVSRSRRTAEIGARVLKLEHEEEMLVEAALAAGHGISRRESVNPAVVLGLRISTRARAAAYARMAAGTSGCPG